MPAETALGRGPPVLCLGGGTVRLEDRAYKPYKPYKLIAVEGTSLWVTVSVQMLPEPRCHQLTLAKRSPL